MKRRGRNWLAHERRSNPNAGTRLLWSRLNKNQLGVTFVREWQIGFYFATFACRSKKIAVEVDDGQYAGIRNEAARFSACEVYGFSILCFWDIDVLSYTDSVVQAIGDAIEFSSQPGKDRAIRIYWPSVS